MKTYLVGGAVRDAWMARAHGEPPPAHADRDWVVVGATPEQMVAQGFLPVGRDFPVFLHPETREEYALARTERKTAPGYHGFTFHTDPGVTLQQDLARRDLTINAMAVNAAHADDPLHAPLIDPFGGRADLDTRVLRHVTDAFAEDPVRILRVARFAARWPDFTVAAPTMALMQRMVAQGEVDHLVPERVWQEVSRGLMEQRPSRLFEVLHDAGALARLLPDMPDPARVRAVLDAAARAQLPLTVRFACLTTGLDLDGGAIGRLATRWRVPNDCRALAEVVGRERGALHGALALDAAGTLRLLERCDALRKPARFDEVLQACACEAGARLAGSADPWPVGVHLRAALARARAVDTAPLAAQAVAEGLAGAQVGARIDAARIAAIARDTGESA